MWTNQYDLIPNLGTNFTGYKKLGTKFHYRCVLLFMLLDKVCPKFYHIRQEGWSEPAATSAPDQDEVIQAILGMNQKHILPYPRFLVFSASSLPQSFSFLPIFLLPTSPHFEFTPSSELEARGQTTSPHFELTPSSEIEVRGQKREGKTRSQKQEGKSDNQNWEGKSGSEKQEGRNGS
jgi:hypothetical protein